MKCQDIITLLHLTFIASQVLTAEVGYDCSQFSGVLPNTHLAECPPAKFMKENNLTECFDSWTKDHWFTDYGLVGSYWCFSRLDVDEDLIKDFIIATTLEDNEIKDLMIQSFSTKYLYNDTHFKCDSEEEWASSWHSIDTDSTLSLCLANTSLPVNLKYHATGESL